MIYGKRIRFRAIEREDLPVFVRWINDPEVREGLTMYLPISMEQEKKWFESILEMHPDEHPLAIEVRDGEGWKHIGNIGLIEINRRTRSAEVGIMIGEKSEWNKGYGTEAMELMLQHGFNTINLNRVSLRVHETNPRAIRAYEKAGFVHEGCYRQGEYINGQFVDLFFMSALRSEWENKVK
jgi:RimJ/RimL family protein N-acetyltransferase